MEQRKFLKLTKCITGKSILIPVDSIISIEEVDVTKDIENIKEDNIVSITWQSFDDTRRVFVKESIKDITIGSVFVIL